MPLDSRCVLLVHGPTTDPDALLDAVGSGDDTARLVVDVCAGAAEALVRFDPTRHEVLLVDDVVVDDVLADAGGRSVVAALRARRPELVVVVLVSDGDAPAVADAVRAGATGVVTRDALGVTLAAAIAAGGPDVCVIERSAAGLLAAAWPTATERLLSAREMDVLECLAGGLTNAQIAARLYVSRETVKTHVAHVLRKLEVGDRSAAVARARRLGLLADPAPPAGLLA